MSNEVLNAHIKLGEPAGRDADLATISDWAGESLLNLLEACRMASEDLRLDPTKRTAYNVAEDLDEAVRRVKGCGVEATSVCAGTAPEERP